MGTRSKSRKQPVDYDKEIEKLAVEQDQYMDARAAELLNHDPELVDLYQRGKQWKLSAKDLQGRLIEIIESERFAHTIQTSIGAHKNVVGRIREVMPIGFIEQGIATDCVEALEIAGESLKVLAAAIRQQISDLPTLDMDSEQWAKVEEAGFKAMVESMRKYSHRIHKYQSLNAISSVKYLVRNDSYLADL